MKKRITSAVILFVLLFVVMSANPTQSQKKTEEPDTLPVVPNVQVVEDSALISPNNSRIDAVTEKAKAVEKVLEKDDKRADKMQSQVAVIQARQVRILKAFTPAVAERMPKLEPKPAADLRVEAESPTIKPIEPSKESWWRKVFNRK